MSSWVVVLVCWAVVATLGAAWLGGAARLVAQEDERHTREPADWRDGAVAARPEG